MGLRNLRLRGGSYHWRRKITVAGTHVPLCFSLRTGNYKHARCMADRLNVAVEGVRMAYGQSTGMRPDQLKKVFSDALRWQLQRILEDQARTYDEEAELSLKLDALKLLTPLTAHIPATLPIRLRPPERRQHRTRAAKVRLK